MSQPQPCLLFDLDGTLVDTDRIHLEAFNRMLAPFGRSVTVDEYKTAIMGFPNTTIMPRLLPGLDGAEHERLAHEKEEMFRGMADMLEPLHGLLDLLAWANDKGCAIGVVTNAPRANAEMVLDALGLMERFHTVVIADDLPHQKPHPLPYLTGLERLGSAADRAVAFEDSRSGVTAAHKAGLPVVGITTSLAPAALIEAGAVLAVENYNDPRVLDLVVTRTGLA
jgi:HAD superfamily hydrolase (TIGR01509 family)